MVEKDEGPYDLTFIDADKGGYPEYLEWALRLSRPGSLILGDNAIMGGSVMEPEEESARGIREFNERFGPGPSALGCRGAPDARTGGRARDSACIGVLISVLSGDVC
jgi:hypothetical protein